MKTYFRFTRSLPIPFLSAVAVAAVGCASLPGPRGEASSDPVEGLEQGYYFYLDGAGGTTAKQNWAESVKAGLLDGGYHGEGELFTWEKGVGVKANADTSAAYKQKRAEELAWAVEDQLEAMPGAPVEIIAYSADCSIALLALEALPASAQVDNVVLLGAVIGETEDLTEALKRVKGSVTIFTATGCRVPDGASVETGNLYVEKILTMPWDASAATDAGDSLKREFIRDQVSPFLIGGGGLLFDTGDGYAGGGEWLFEEE